MLKGVRKNMIFVQLPKAKSFESAYFVIRSGLRDREPRQGEMVKEANRIVGELELDGKKKRERSERGGRIAFFFYGLILGCASVSVAWLLTLIFT